MNELKNKLGSVFSESVAKSISRLKFMEMGANVSITPEKPSSQDYSKREGEYNRV